MKLLRTKSIVTGAGMETREDPLHREVPGLAATVGGVKHLGAPLGSWLFENAILPWLVGGIKILLEALPTLT